MEIRPLSDSLGYEVLGVDLTQPLDTEARDSLLDAFLAHHLLCFRTRPLQPTEFAQLARAFGEPQPQLVRHKRDPAAPAVSILESTYKSESDKPTDLRLMRLSGWHTDDSYFERPAKATMLQALEIPSVGGETRFCNTRRVYEDLTDDLKLQLDGLAAVHGYDTHRTPATAEALTSAESTETRDVVHPLVRTHEDTGIKAIYFNANRTDRVVGMQRAESDELLDTLLKRIMTSKHQYQHQWRVGDLLLWDNRCLVHSVNMDFPVGERRRHQRLLLKGTRPA